MKQQHISEDSSWFKSRKLRANVRKASLLALILCTLPTMLVEGRRLAFNHYYMMCEGWGRAGMLGSSQFMSRSTLDPFFLSRSGCGRTPSPLQNAAHTWHIGHRWTLPMSSVSPNGFQSLDNQLSGMWSSVSGKKSAAFVKVRAQVNDNDDGQQRTLRRRFGKPKLSREVKMFQAPRTSTSSSDDATNNDESVVPSSPSSPSASETGGSKSSRRESSGAADDEEQLQMVQQGQKPSEKRPRAQQPQRKETSRESDDGSTSRIVLLDDESSQYPQLLSLGAGVGLLTGATIIAFSTTVHLLQDILGVASNGEITALGHSICLAPEPFLSHLSADARNIIAPVTGGILSTGLLVYSSVAAEAEPNSFSFKPNKSTNPKTAKSYLESVLKWSVKSPRKSQKAKIIAACINLGTGNSLGPEGPSVEIGKAWGGLLGKTSKATLDTALAAGMAAGVSAGFNAPVSGVLFALETALRSQKVSVTTIVPRSEASEVGQAAIGGEDKSEGNRVLESGTALKLSEEISDGGSPSSGEVDMRSNARINLASRHNPSTSPSSSRLQGVSTSTSRPIENQDSLAAVVVAAVVASVTSRIGLGEAPALFNIPKYELGSYFELPLYAGVGILSGFASIAFSRSQELLEKVAVSIEQKRVLPGFILPSIASLATGLIALKYPEVMYQGFDNFNRILEGSVKDGEVYGAILLLQITLAKIFTTTIAKGFGLEGGLYAPSLFIGAALGLAYGISLRPFLEGFPIDLSLLSAPQSYALAGMAGTLAGICRIPLTASLILFEITRDYGIILPILISVAVSSLQVIKSNNVQKMYVKKETSSQGEVGEESGKDFFIDNVTTPDPGSDARTSASTYEHIKKASARINQETVDDFLNSLRDSSRSIAILYEARNSSGCLQPLLAKYVSEADAEASGITFTRVQDMSISQFFTQRQMLNKESHLNESSGSIEAHPVPNDCNETGSATVSLFSVAVKNTDQ